MALAASSRFLQRRPQNAVEHLTILEGRMRWASVTKSARDVVVRVLLDVVRQRFADIVWQWNAVMLLALAAHDESRPLASRCHRSGWQ